MDEPALFLSYNSADRVSVVAVQRVLAARGITTFLDRDQLVPGLPWPSALEEGLRRVRAVAVFIGREVGGWQMREIYFALDRQVSDEKKAQSFPVIPILLPGGYAASFFMTLVREAAIEPASSRLKASAYPYLPIPQILVGDAGIEPALSRLRVECICHLCQSPMFNIKMVQDVGIEPTPRGYRPRARPSS
jgi:hypothetical protein